MRLRLIEAVRYGALTDTTLGDLDPGLTVVHGPNEAGKSSFTSLVRHVLYGYPNLRDTEEGYHVGGEGRCARLVFDDESGSWMLERTEGVHGGALRVKTLAGVDRPGLADELTRGVSSRTFRTVFGFGLDQMAAIAQERGSEDGVVARLYAAGAGLRVNPQEVRSAIDREAAELFKPSGRKQPANALIGELRAVRGELRTLRGEAESYLVERARLHAMEADLEKARRFRDAARERATESAVALERVDDRLLVIEAADSALPELLRGRKRLEDEGASLGYDAELLNSAPELDALVEEAAGHTRALQSLADSEAAVLRAQTRYSDAVDRAGADPESLEALADSLESHSIIDEAREDLQRLQMQCETRDEAVMRARSDLEQAEEELARQLSPLGITGSISESIAERLAAIDAVESGREGAPGGKRRDVPSLILLASGVIAAAAGLALTEWVTAVIGAVLAATGVILVLRPGSATASPPGDERAYLRILGLEPSASALDLSRARRSLDAARAGEVALRGAQRALDDARRDSGLGCDALQARRTLWAEWLTANGLAPTLTPAAAASVLTLAREARAQRLHVEEARQAHERALGQLGSFASRFASAAGALLGLSEAPAIDEVPPLANRLKEMLAQARSRAARVEAIRHELAALDGRIAAEEQRAHRARQELLEVLERFDLAEGGTHEDLRVLHAAAVWAETEATDAYDSLAQEKHQLEGRLEQGAREGRAGELHLGESALVERLHDTVDRYLVLSLASRLLGEAQSRYQRERQPDVVRRAGEVFASMTGDRYVGLTVPLGEGRIEVIDSRNGVRTSDILSRGTAEQLYLAVRLGLVSRLGDVGRGLPVIMDDVLVNFDPERRRGAAVAIARLAAERQVLFFTCHPDTAALLAEVSPGHTRIELGRVG